jgi:chromosome segregation ATPase
VARAGVYRTEVEKARDSLLAQGKHPSVDAVRIALGNTGSKTTIHRYLKELEAEDTEGVGGKFPIGEALTDLVSRLAGRLNEEADSRIAEAQARCEAQVRDREQQLAHQKQEAQTLRDQLDHSHTRLTAETAEHLATRQALVEATVRIRALEERVSGLTTRVGEHEAHATSLETKHEQAREALEHFRVAAKEQREQERRRHEHQVQGLQLELRQAQESVTAKNQEVLQLNRDNARLSEHVGQQDKELTQLRSTVRERDHELKALRPLVGDCKALEARFVYAEATIGELTAERAELRTALSRERDARQALEGEKVRVATLEDVLARIQDRRRPPSETIPSVKDPS